MSTGSAIQWTDATWNPVTGCTRVSAGCDHCYAVGMTHRLEGMGQGKKYGGLTVLNGNGDRHFNGTVRCHEDDLEKPLHWRKPRRVFVNSMSDLFHRDVPFDFIDRVFAVMALTPQHTYQVLTKRPERMAEYTARRRLIPGGTMMGGRQPWKSSCDDVYQIVRETKPDAPLVWPLPNVWLLTSVEDQPSADERIPHLLRCQAAVRGLSCEPLLGPVDLSPWLEWGANGPPWLCGNCDTGERVWVIVGGESGPGARPMDVEWARSLIAQCRSADVPVFIKQLGSRPVSWPCASGQDCTHPDCMDRGAVPWDLKSRKGGDPSEWPADLRVREFPSMEVSAA